MSDTETQFMRPNIFVRTNSTDINEVEMTEFWEPVIVWLADKFPKWKFVGIYLTQVEATRFKEVEHWKYYPRRWNVYLDGEELGTIGKDHYGSKPCYTISNDRIQEKRERGWADKTTKIEKAKKLVMKNFRPKDLKELTHACVNTVRGSVSSSVYSSNNQYARLLGRFTNYLTGHLEDNLDTYMQVARDAGYTEEREFRDAQQTQKIHWSMDKCTREKRGAVVLIHGDTYAVQTDENQFYTYENATLPDLLKRRVGMLKLVENGQTLVNVGYRENENQYYVSLEEDNGAS